jgi:hypothetical protein
MSRSNRTCSRCQREFVLKPGKPGLIHHCPQCSTETVELLGGNMIYQHKTGGYIEVKPLEEARRFAKKTKRLGAGVTASITESKIDLREYREEK